MSEEPEIYNANPPKDEMDFLKEIYQAAKRHRELSLMSGTPITRDSRRRATGELDKAILDYEENHL